MISLSTGWRAMTVPGGAELIEAVRKLGGDALELSYHVKESTFKQMIPVVKREAIRITSIHNYFPASDNPDAVIGGELYLYTSDDPDERRLAVKRTISAMEIAHDLEARAIILHLGHVQMLDPTRRLKELYDAREIEEDEATRLLDDAFYDRAELAPVAIDHALFCLDELNRAAERLEVFVCLENRYHLSEVPNFQDFGRVLAEFPKESMVRYWHDVGHGEVNRNLRFGDGKALLEAYGGNLFGIHLHDVKDGHRDHQAPGSGSVDWESIKGFITPETIKVLELAPELPFEEAQSGLAFLRELGIA